MTKKITPELLRECAEKYLRNSSYSVTSVERDLDVERTYVDRRITNVLNGIADSIEQYYIELPTDKDGKQLYIGSAVYDKDGNIYYVQGVSAGEQNVFLAKFGEGTDCAKLYRSQDFTKEKPDSWEQIIRYATTVGCAYLGDTEEDSAFDKLAAERQELIARCRKLAGESK